MICLLAMIKPSNEVRPIVMGKHCVNLQAMFYAFNFVMPLQHIFPHTNLELQPRVDVKL
jgi:hypothetical protein